MEASKLVIDPDHLRFQKMDGKKRHELRTQNIIALIKSKPAGTVIKGGEFMQVTAMRGTNVYSLLHTLTKKGIITRVSEDKGYLYTVNDSVTIKPKRTADKAQPATATPSPLSNTLIEYARQFAWECNSDSLRGFVAYVDGKELDLRRQMDGRMK